VRSPLGLTDGGSRVDLAQCAFHRTSSTGGPGSLPGQSRTAGRCCAPVISLAGSLVLRARDGLPSPGAGITCEGDSIAFPSSMPHRYVNPTDGESRAITVILDDGELFPAA